MVFDSTISGSNRCDTAGMAFESNKTNKGPQNKVAMQLGAKIRPRQIEWGFGAACRSMDDIASQSASRERNKDNSQRRGAFQVKSAVAMLNS